MCDKSVSIFATLVPTHTLFFLFLSFLVLLHIFSFVFKSLSVHFPFSLDSFCPPVKHLEMIDKGVNLKVLITTKKFVTVYGGECQLDLLW